MSTVVSTLASLLTAEQVLSLERIPPALAAALASTTAAGSLPEAVVYPHSEAELCEIMACTCAQRWRVLPFGSGSKLGWGGLATGFDVAIGTQYLNQVIGHAVGDMTLTAAAGAKLSDLRPQLAQHQQFLAIDPAYPDRASLGGIVATADTGAWRQRYNSIRDMLIGISFVRYDGKVAKAGGRVVKNVAGYDLMKLMTGAYGTLGIISQVTFRLYPIPDTSKTAVIWGPAEAVSRLTADLRQSALTPVALDLLSPALAAALDYDRSFAVAARFQSNAPGVDEQLTRLSKMVTMSALKLQILDQAQEASFWERLTETLFPFGSDKQSDGDEVPDVLAKLGVLPNQAMNLLTQLQDQVPQGSLARIHAGSGIGTLRCTAEVATPEFLNRLRQSCEAKRGYLTVLQASKSVKQSLDIWGCNSSSRSLMRRLKETFDPDALLNPGRFVVGL